MIDGSAQTRRLTALVADDDGDFRQAMAEIIAMDGWHVLEAADGEEAVHIVGTSKPDVLVLDHRMPKMTGAQVIHHLRNVGVHVPVVFVSAAYELREIAAGAGVRCHLTKPFGIDELLTLMRRALDGHCG